MEKQSILFVYVNYSSFVKADFEILSTFANVTKYQFKPGKGIFRTGVEVLKEFIFLIFNIFKFDSVFVWFGDYHSLLPVLFAKLFCKKSFVVIGGYDVSTLGEYKYGAFSNPIRAFFTRNTFKFVDVCFPVAEALRKKLLLINPKAKAETIATSVDTVRFSFSEYERPKRIITVSGTDNHQRLMVKGLDRFRELAVYLPEFEFIIIGATDGVKSYFEPVPANLSLLPPQQFDQLTGYYESASFYAQLSRSEGLPNALCEAMLCGCIPVGTNVGDIQITIGDSGLTIDNWNPEALTEFIRQNHNKIQLRDCARQRIISLYNPAIRVERFRLLMGKSSEVK
ncbi:MAG TPA: glycosyltransferase family 4 protein [Prolixibacteraceae bacterium]|jgi:glycosyltransferase involved in cell wall biosynthesis